MENSVKNLIQFIDHSPSCFHVIENAKKQFLEHGFIQLEEKEHWNLEEGKSYFVERNGSSMIAFHLPKKDFQGFHIVASHSDSPTYRIKEQPEMSVEKHYTKLNIERYGGMIPETWFDRPLSVAGRIIIEENGQIKDQLVNVDRDLMIIPNLAIHMSRSSNESKQLNPQKDLLPLCGGNLTKDGFEEMIAKESGVEKEDILSYDLFLYNRMRGTTLGINEEFVAAPKLDDLECAYSSIEGMLNAELSKDYVTVCAVFDNEEVGSGTKQGAGSTFGADVLKYNVAQKYTTDARSAAPEKAAYIYAGQIRDELGSRLDLLEKNAYRFCYINDFPMSGTAQDLMYGAPSEITEQQLREVHIKVRD